MIRRSDYAPRAATAIIIPARMASTRLPNKPLADIGGKSMILRVWEQAKASDVGSVIVATADKAIAKVIEAAGGETVMTPSDLPSGSDRIAAALRKFDAEGRYNTIVNLQGDMPLISPDVISACLDPLKEPAVDISTVVAKITDEAELTDPNAVKAMTEFAPGRDIARVSDFCRLLPENHRGPAYHHIGIYGYRRTALETFVKLPVGKRERLHSLEQLRALDAGMRIDAVCVDTVPIGVDTPADLETVRRLHMASDKT